MRFFKLLGASSKVTEKFYPQLLGKSIPVLYTSVQQHQRVFICQGESRVMSVFLRASDSASASASGT